MSLGLPLVPWCKSSMEIPEHLLALTGIERKAGHQPVSCMDASGH